MIFKRIARSPILASFTIALLAAPPGIAAAQSAGGTSLTITPPFFTINVAPGDVWASSIRVVNANGGNLPVAASLMGFTAGNDQGQGTFTKLSELANDRDALANWITLDQPNAVVPPASAADIPFSITVPPDASPGGHYAAILIGTPPASGAPAGSHVGVSSFISALIFVRVSGDIIENGDVREFSADKGFYQDPDVRFSVRFANTGNVHVRPVGQIQIFNAFGKEEGKVPLNEDGNLGYVLPSSTRLFNASWQGPGDLWDVGPYSAVVTLAFGENGSQSVSQSLTFWVVPWERLLEDAGILIIAIGIFIFFLRRWIRRMLEREMGKFGGAPHHTPSHVHQKEEKSDDILDLRRRP